MRTHSVLDGAEVMDYQMQQSIPMGGREMKEADKSTEGQRWATQGHYNPGEYEAV